MKIYENLLLPVDEWFVSSTLQLDNNGFFRYQELWDCYAGSVKCQAEGKWQRMESIITLETECLDGSPRLEFIVGQHLEAHENENSLDFSSGFTMFIRWF